MFRWIVLILCLSGACTDHEARCPEPADASVVADLAVTVDADASDMAGSCAVPDTLVSYLKTTSTDLTDTRCGPVSNGVCTIDLKGYLYVPDAQPPYPAIIFNHGSEQHPGQKCTIANYFVPRGYLVFMPHRRGHGQSTGVYLTDYTAGSQISYLEMQVADVQAAYTFVAAMPTVDPHKMAIAGHSYGGIMTLLTNATALGQAAGIDLCGDSESWLNDSYRTALMTAVDNARSPMFFLQPANDVHTDPTIEFSHQAGIDRQQFQAAVYPPVPNVASAEEAHSHFVTDSNQVALWGPAALDFLHRYGM